MTTTSTTCINSILGVGRLADTWNKQLQLHVRAFLPQSKRELNMLRLANEAERKIKAGQTKATSLTAEDQPL